MTDSFSKMKFVHLRMMNKNSGKIHLLEAMEVTHSMGNPTFPSFLKTGVNKNPIFLGIFHGFFGGGRWTQSLRSASQLFGKKQFLGSFEDEEEVWTTQTSCFVETLAVCLKTSPKKQQTKKSRESCFFVDIFEKRYRFFLC